MKHVVALFLLWCINASASLLLTISDPNQSVNPGSTATYHGTLQNTDAVAYNIVSFVLLNSPTDVTDPPILGSDLFPTFEPAIPFTIGAGGQFTGIIVSIDVPASAHLRTHAFAISAASDVHGPSGDTVASPLAPATLTVAPEPGSAILVALAFSGLLAWKTGKNSE